MCSPRSPWQRFKLTWRVQADAFSFNPAAYLQAVVWRLRGLRIRSRNRIATLAGRSPSAYALWIARDEPVLCSGQLVRAAAQAGQVIPVIDCQSSSNGLEATLRSLASNGSNAPVIIIGGPPTAGATNLSHPSEIARFITRSETWLCPLRPGDRIAPFALDRYSMAAGSAGNSRIIYSDDDLLSSDGERSEPHFKPVWNPELFENHDFLTGSAIVRVTRENLRDLRADRWDEQLIGEALRCSDDPIHLPLVLHHRRARPEPRVPAKPRDLVPNPAPSITAIIPTRNHLSLLRKCVEGLRGTAYPGVNLIIVDNGSDDPATLDYLKRSAADGVTVLQMPGPFNYSAINNAAALRAEGEFLCFLNNDVEMTDPDWLSLLVRQAMRPEIGAVGARLLYADLTVQHAGVFIGIGGGAGHAHRLLRHDEPGYFNRARLPQRVSAVTGACFVVAREKFLSVGGFDEQEFPVAFNDVDLCLKLNANGWQTFYEPRATLIHHESKSRGSDSAKPNRARFAAELAALKRKWHTDVQHDPYHHPHLSRFCEQFLISV